MLKINNKKNHNTSRKGMTLLEVVVVIAIVGIMSAVSIVSYMTSKRNAELETAAEEIVSVLREAQNYALTGKGISSICNVYGVNFSSGSNYTLSNGAGCPVNQPYTLKNGVIISSPIDTSFTAPHATINPIPGGGWRTISISKGGATMNICINSAGLIKKMNINTACN